MSISSWPTPTVSIKICCFPAASSSSATSARARASPPKNPRVAIERMNMPASPAWPCMRMRSPRIAPPVYGLLGSTAMTPTASCSCDSAPPAGPPACSSRCPARRSFQSDKPARVRKQNSQQRLGIGVVVLNRGDRARETARTSPARTSSAHFSTAAAIFSFGASAKIGAASGMQTSISSREAAARSPGF